MTTPQLPPLPEQSMTHHITDEQIVALKGGPSQTHREFARAVLALAAPAQQGEPFGYFRATAFGWEDCAAGDEGAIALYTALTAATTPSQAPAVPMSEVDLHDDDALRFAQRVLESDAPESDRKAARDMLVAIRTRVRKARAALTAAPTPPVQDAEHAGLVSANGHLSTLLNESTQMLAQLRAMIDALHDTWSNGGRPERGEFSLLDRVDDWLNARPSEMLEPQHATPAQPAVPEDVGSGLPSDPVAWRWFNSNGPVGDWRPLRPGKRSEIESQVADAGGRIEYACVQASPAVPESADNPPAQKGEWVSYNPLTATYDTLDGTSVTAELVENVQCLSDVLRIAQIRHKQRTTIATAVPEDVARDAERLDYMEELVKSKGAHGVSFDYVRHVEDGYVVEKGFRVMWRHTLGERKPTLRAAIDAARAAEKGGE